jgi:pSer/pThr/pTyr-binding forkhead associated (FHA) protein
VENSPYLYAQAVETYVEDLGSTNGTLVNGSKIDRAQIKHGDVVKIGQHEFEFIDENQLRMERTMVIKPGESLK